MFKGLTGRNVCAENLTVSNLFGESTQGAFILASFSKKYAQPNLIGMHLCFIDGKELFMFPFKGNWTRE